MGLNRYSSAISLLTKISVGLWLAAQIVVIICYWGAPQYSDAGNYAVFAAEAVADGAIYPTAAQFADNLWIANTGYVNFLVLNLYIFGNLNFVGLEQLLFSCLLLWSLWKLTRRYSDAITANLAVIVFCLLPSNTLNTPTHMSDMLCCALFLWSFAIMRRSVWWLVFAGAVAAVANWVRPIGMIYWPSVAILGWMACHKAGIGGGATAALTAAYAAGVLAVNIVIAGSTYASCGYALTGSTTKGTNMLIGCNDGATGDYSDAVFRPGGVGEVTDCANAVERDKELTSRSVRWIIDNPGRFAALAPVKVFRLWCADHYSFKVLDNPAGHRASMVETGLWSIPYYIVIALAALGIWHLRRRLWGVAGAVLLPLVLGTGMHLLMYGGMRYHYPMMPVVIYFAAVGASALLRRLSPRICQ